MYREFEHRTRTLPLVLVLAVFLAVPAAASAQVKVIISGGFSAAYTEVLPEFQRTSGTAVTTTRGQSLGSSPNSIGNQLRRGVAADVIILSREGLNELMAEGRIMPGTDTDLGSTPLGVAVRAGTSRPNVGTVEAFKDALLRAKSVTFTSSTSGTYLMTTLFPRLGIAAEMAKKSTTTGVAAVAAGEADLAIQPVSELLPVAGVEVAGILPDEIQKVNTYAAAVVAGSTALDAARRLIAFLASDAAVMAIRKYGMEPSRR